MKKFSPILLIFLILALSAVSNAQAQTASELQLGLSRDFGYNGFGADIQGIFTIRIKSPPENLTRVIFYIDNTSMGEVTKAPFSLQFNTDSYPLGDHTFSAVGYTSDGKELTSNQIHSIFVGAVPGGNMVLKIVLPIVGVLILAVVVSFLIPTVLNRGKMAFMPLGTERKYGIGGGAICPKCGRPFPLRLWYINLGVHKIDRCPFCGKWSLVRPASLEVLRKAEQAELAKAQPEIPISGESEADRLKKELDDSRYQNM